MGPPPLPELPQLPQRPPAGRDEDSIATPFAGTLAARPTPADFDDIPTTLLDRRGLDVLAGGFAAAARPAASDWLSPWDEPETTELEAGTTEIDAGTTELETEEGFQPDRPQTTVLPYRFDLDHPETLRAPPRRHATAPPLPSVIVASPPEATRSRTARRARPSNSPHLAVWLVAAVLLGLASYRIAPMVVFHGDAASHVSQR